jgi:hypothetical protein
MVMVCVVAAEYFVVTLPKDGPRGMCIRVPLQIDAMHDPKNGILATSIPVKRIMQLVPDAKGVTIVER